MTITSAVSAARQILTRLHDVMASRSHAQAKLNTVVEVIAQGLDSEVCSIYLLREGMLELFATKGLAQELIERGIRVNGVAPGPVWTPLVAMSFPGEKLEHFGENTPVGRPAQPAELAPRYVFLASDESRYIVGEIIGITGGKPIS